jgi:hypothetical protein
MHYALRITHHASGVCNREENAVTESSRTQEGEITFETSDDGTRVDLRIDGRSVSRLWVVHITLRIGQAKVRMEGIAGVGTEQEFRRRGYSRRVLEATVERMRAGDAPLSMLYGIRDFYPKFGYATAGPEHMITLTDLARDTSLPEGWHAAPLGASDLQSVYALYDRNIATGVGPAVRSPGGRGWSQLEKVVGGQGPDACRVVKNPAGNVAAYAWQGTGHWAVDNRQRDRQDSLVLGEVMADGPAAADSVLAVCRAWAAEEAARRGEPIEKLVLLLPPEGPVAAAAMRQAALFERRFSRCGGSMARVLHVARLLEALKPELMARLQAARYPFSGRLLFQTDLGDAALVATPDGMSVEYLTTRPGSPDRTAGTSQRLVVHLPQTTLAQLVLGAYPPDDLLARLEHPPDEAPRQLLGVLFPLRHPHMYPADRY